MICEPGKTWKTGFLGSVLTIKTWKNLENGVLKPGKWSLKTWKYLEKPGTGPLSTTGNPVYIGECENTFQERVLRRPFQWEIQFAL